MTTWRYQPVWMTDTNGEDAFYVIEVYLDDKGRLERWQADPEDTLPAGNDLEDLQGELVNMLVDAFRWKPVRCDELRVGMAFEPDYSQSIQSRLQQHSRWKA